MLIFILNNLLRAFLRHQLYFKNIFYLFIADFTGFPSKNGVMYVALSDDSTTTAYFSERAYLVFPRSALYSFKALSYIKADEGDI